MKKSTVVAIISAMLSCLGCLYCIVSDIGFSSGIYVLPVSYFLFNFIFLKIETSLPVILIRLTGFIRYVVVPVSFCLDPDNAGCKFDLLVYVLLIIDLLACLLTIVWFQKFFYRGSMKIGIDDCKIGNMRVFGASATVISLIALLILLKNPVILLNFVTFKINDRLETDPMWGFFAIIVNVFIVFSFIKILKIVYNIRSMKMGFKVLLSLGAGALFVNGIYISSGQSISRWAIVINAIIIMIFLCKLYPLYKKKMVMGIMVVVLPTIMLMSTYYKFESKYSNEMSMETMVSVINDIISYNVLNAYFNGPTNVDYAIKAANSFHQSISCFTFINDLFANAPLLNKYLSNGQDITPYYFNYTIFNSTIACDQICPLIGQAYMLFGLFFCPVLTCLFTFLALKFYQLSLSGDNLLYQYCILVATINCSLLMCLNLNIIFQSLWIKVLPIYLVLLSNYKVSISR